MMGFPPQTKEAIDHARSADVPIVVAINKIDKPGADIDRVKSELAKLDIIGEDWGGDILMQNISAKQSQGIDELLDAILLQAEVMELKAPVACPGKGVVIESSLDKGRGAVATIILDSGTVNTGNIVVAGNSYGRVRAMMDDQGKKIKTCGPAIPFEMLGLSEVPSPGDELIVVKSDKEARQLISEKSDSDNKDISPVLNPFDSLQKELDENKRVNLLIKADTHGSLEALKDSLSNLSNDEITVNIVGASVGGINEGEINLATTTNALIIGFNVKSQPIAAKMAQEKININKILPTIYDVINDVSLLVKGMMKPQYNERVIGAAKVKELFNISKMGVIAGCIIVDGSVTSDCKVRVIRQDAVIYEGEITSLRREKSTATEVKSGTECGIGIKSYNDFDKGDKLEFFHLERIN